MQELEFLAEEELVEILPRMRIDRLHFISVRISNAAGATPCTHIPSTQGTFGPFAPGMPVKVPLWLALALKEATKCDIQCPEWMTAGMSPLREELGLCHTRCCSPQSLFGVRLSLKEKTPSCCMTCHPSTWRWPL